MLLSILKHLFEREASQKVRLSSASKLVIVFLFDEVLFIMIAYLGLIV